MDHALAVWDRLPLWARTLAATGWRAGERYVSRSEADAAVLRALIDAGATDNEIKHVFYYLPQGIGVKYRTESGDRYLEHSIDSLRISVDDVAAYVYKVEGRYYARVHFRILEGEHEGREFWTYLSPNKTYFEYVFYSARMPVPREWTRYTPRMLEGAEVAVRLRERDDGSVDIRRWVYGQDDGDR